MKTGGCGWFVGLHYFGEGNVSVRSCFLLLFGNLLGISAFSFWVFFLDWDVAAVGDQASRSAVTTMMEATGM